MRILPAIFLLPALAAAAILPDAIGAFNRAATSKPALADQAVWNEYGLKDSESAVYESAGSKLTATAYRLQDSTGALAAFQWIRDPKAVPSQITGMAAETPASLLVAHGNYVLLFDGYKPVAAELQAVLGGLPNVDTTSPPPLLGYFPRVGLVPNSDRYIVGPASLQKFNPGIPPSVAGFHLGAEVEFGVFHGSKGDTALALFNYPTNQMAMAKINDFGKLPGAMVKRAGPMVAVILAPPDADEAERLLALVRWEAAVTLNERTNTARDNIGNLVINAFVLIGILLTFCLVSGFFVGGARRFLLRGKKGEDASGMILLHLENPES